MTTENNAFVKTRIVAPLISGLGGFILIFILAGLESLLKGTGAALIDIALLAASFGASCVLVFAIPQSPLARPKNVIGGHLISTLVGLILLFTLGASPLTMALGVGLAIALMQATETLHPPAGGDPLIVLLAAGAYGWSFLLAPILISTVAIVIVGWFYHKFISKRDYSLAL